MATKTIQVREGNPELRTRASELLARYPDIDETERAELLDFYNRSAAIDTALLACDPLLLTKMAQFEADHRDRLRHEGRLTLLLWIVAICIALIVYAVWAGV